METQPPDKTKPPGWLAPLVNSGFTLGPWLRLFGPHLHRVNWRCWPLLAVAAVIAALRSGLEVLTRLRYARRVAATPIREAPVFVLGHWRSGTTLLHELLSLDARFAAPTLFECFHPTTFLLTDGLVMRLAKLFPSARRPQDNMTISAGSPNEDEFALLRLGAGSPYAVFTLPREGARFMPFLDVSALPQPERERWKAALLGFVRAVTHRHGGRRLVLKSPTHTARVKTLLELFPDAKFVNIVRDPRVVHPSTLHTMKTLTALFSLQCHAPSAIEAQVVENHLLLHRRLAEARPLIPAGNFAEIRYENLVRDPAGELERVYGALGLGGFDAVRPQVASYFAERSGYKTNRYEMSPEERARVEGALREVIEATGYA